MNRVVVQRRKTDVGDVAVDPAPHRQIEAERPTHQQPRRVEARIVGVDEAKVDLAFVAKPSLGDAGVVAIVQVDINAATSKLQRNAGSLESLLPGHNRPVT